MTKTRTLISGFSLPQLENFKISWKAGVWIALLVGVVLPRIAAIGYFPHMDDGSYAFYAQYMMDSHAEGKGFPQDLGRFLLYPFMFAWVYLLPGNALIWFRFIDLFMAVIAGWLFCKIMARESKSEICGLLLSLAFLTALNLPDAIDSGFKHSFAPAFICFFYALILADGEEKGLAKWYWIGALAALGTLLRETFVIFTILGACAILFGRGFGPLWRYVAGGIICGLLITILCALIRGQLWGLISGYFYLGDIYGAEKDRRWPKFIQNGYVAIKIYWPLLTLYAAACASLLAYPGKKTAGRAAFWIFAALLPIIEPFSKIGFVYHFSVCLPGMAGLCALGYSLIPDSEKKIRNAALWATLLAFFLVAPSQAKQYEKIGDTWGGLESFASGTWEGPIVSKSNTLMASQIIRDNMPKDGKLAVSGFAYYLYPASLETPPSEALSDLSRTYIRGGYDVENFRKELDKNPPDIIALAYTYNDHSATFQDILDEIFDNDQRYREIAIVPIDFDKNYGWLGFRLLKKVGGKEKNDAQKTALPPQAEGEPSLSR